jgi:hypothetical protein
METIPPEKVCRARPAGHSRYADTKIIAKRIIRSHLIPFTAVKVDLLQ